MNDKQKIDSLVNVVCELLNMDMLCDEIIESTFEDMNEDNKRIFIKEAIRLGKFDDLYDNFSDSVYCCGECCECPLWHNDCNNHIFNIDDNIHGCSDCDIRKDCNKFNNSDILKNQLLGGTKNGDSWYPVD